MIKNEEIDWRRLGDVVRNSGLMYVGCVDFGEDVVVVLMTSFSSSESEEFEEASSSVL